MYQLSPMGAGGRRILRWLPVVFLLALIPAYWITFRLPGTGMMHDDGVYLVTAKALAEGKGYRIISHPGQIVQTKYPILFPAILSLLWRISPKFPENIHLLKALPATAAILWLFVAYRMGRRVAGISTVAALWIVFFTAANQWTLFLATTVMSESLFALLVFITLLALIRVTKAPNEDWIATISAALLAGAALQTRSAGLALVIAGLSVLIIAKKFRQAAVFGLICGAFMAGWSVWQHQTVLSTTAVEAYYTAQNYKDSSLLAAHLPSQENATVFILNVLHLTLYPVQLFPILFVPRLHWLVFSPFGIAFWVCVVRGILKTPELRPAHIFLAVYVSMLTVWIWEPSRLLVPTIPLLLLFAYKGLPRKVPGFVAPLAAVGPLVIAALFAANSSAQQFASFADLPWVPKTDKYHPNVDWRLLSEMHSWIANNTPRGSVVLTSFDPVMYLYSGHPSIRPFIVDGMALFYVENRDLKTKKREFEATMQHNGAQYLAETGHDDVEEPDYEKLVAELQRDGRIRVLKEFAPKYRIFEIESKDQAIAR